MRKERRFNGYADSCPFRRDNRCSSSCAFFVERGDAGRCRLVNGSGDSAATGYFFECESQPYGNYH